MTGNDAREALLARIAASYDGTTLFSEAELREWPKTAVIAFKKAGLLVPMADADSVTCEGCEQRCHMPLVFSRVGGRSTAFVVCDKGEEVGPMEVDLETLEQWPASA